MPLSSKIGLSLFAILVLNFACRYGSWWEFGSRDGMPSTLLAPDGQHLRDGSEIDPITLAVVRSGYEEEVYLCALVIMAALVLLGVGIVRRAHRKHLARLEEIRRFYEKG